MTHDTNHDITTHGQYRGDGATGDFQLGSELRLNAIALDERAGPVLHRDLGSVPVTDADADGLGAITINRTKSGLSPFTPIIKTPTYSEHSGTLSGYAVEIEHPDSETGFRHVGNVSKSYLLLPNAEVRELAVEIALQSRMPFRESRIFWDGSRFCHVIDFLDREAEDLGGIGLSLITRSSYDKSWRYEMRAHGPPVRLRQWGDLRASSSPASSFKHLAPRPPGDDNDEGPKEESWQEIVRQGM